MKKKNTAEIVFVASSFLMLLIFTAAFIYYILFKEVLFVLVGLGIASFLTGVIAKNRWEAGKKT